MENEIVLADLPAVLQSTPVWLDADIVSIRRVTPTMKAYRFSVPWANDFYAGQCVDFRLTAEDGYTAQRYYSIATAPSPDGFIEVMVEHQAGGEVSAFFHEGFVEGDTVSLRGPIGGGPFTWQPASSGPVLLVGGGSGVVPLLSMVRHRRRLGDSTPFTLLYSARRFGDVLAREELFAIADEDRSFQLVVNLTREVDAPAPFQRGRLTRETLSRRLQGIWSEPAVCFLCGSNGFVGDVSDMLLERGMAMHQVRTERFGG